MQHHFKIKQIPKIKSVMTPFPYSVDLEASIDEARKLMEDHNIYHLPVTEAGELMSIVSSQDITIALNSKEAFPRKEATPVKDICEPEVYIVDLSERLDNVAMHMSENNIPSALVIKDGKLVGVFTITDACRCLAEILRAVFPEPEDDLIA